MNHSDQTKQITAQTEKMLIDQYERLYRLAYSYVHNEADALDIVQESACKAITQCKNLKDTEKLFPWLCRIVVNTSLDLLRSRTKEQPAEELPETALYLCFLPFQHSFFQFLQFCKKIYEIYFFTSKCCLNCIVTRN